MHVETKVRNTPLLTSVRAALVQCYRGLRAALDVRQQAMQALLTPAL